MRTRLLLGGIGLSALLLGAFHVSVKDKLDPRVVTRFAETMSKPSAWQGRLAPDFELTLLSGETFRLTDHVGKKIVVLNFFTTWCGPCREEMPELERFYRAHSGEALVLLGVDCSEERGLVEAFVAELKPTFPVAIDKGAVAKAYGVDSYPRTVVIGGDGRIALYESGSIANADVSLAPTIVERLAALKAGQVVSAEEYRRLVAAEPKRPRADATSEGDEELPGRAQTIAVKMTCPCGCDHTVAECSCGTAKAIRAELKKGAFGERSDAEIIRDLNRQFCEKES